MSVQRMVNTMFKLKIFCNDGNGKWYWEDGCETYETYDKALVACYETALQETQSLMETSDCHNWFEVHKDFEVTETYETDELKDVSLFPVAVAYYDHAPWNRENDCEIKIVTGYAIVKVKEPIDENDHVAKYNAMLRDTHGDDITVEIKSRVGYDDSVRYYFVASFGESDDAWDTVEEAYEEADCYLHGVGELW